MELQNLKGRIDECLAVKVSPPEAPTRDSPRPKLACCLLQSLTSPRFELRCGQLPKLALSMLRADFETHEGFGARSDADVAARLIDSLSDASMTEVDLP